MAEQDIYAKWLDAGTHAGFLLLVATFLVYTCGIASPHVPLADLPSYWGMPVDAYLVRSIPHTSVRGRPLRCERFSCALRQYV